MVSNVALVIGKMKLDTGVEATALVPTHPAQLDSFDTRKGVIESVFKTQRFDLMHYFGDSGRGELAGPNAGRYLSLAKDTRTLRLVEIGAVEAERAFFKRRPLVMLNCCEGAQKSKLLGGLDSFPHVFIDNACIGCVGTIWPVHSRAANRFMSALYKELANDTFVPAAMKQARKSVLDEARAEGTSAADRLHLTLAARAYVYYGPPDLRCSFTRRTS
jgi:hypothetical protein